jgi:16S rRNA (guanine1516-N2)-methyltransferase
MGGVGAIGFDSALLQERAAALASQLNLVVDNQTLPRLCVTQDKLVLMLEGCSPLFVDFSPATWKKRRDAGKKQGLVRACKPSKGSRILDATAGWGRDSAILASFGADVLMLERQPVIAALLEDGLSRYRRSLGFCSNEALSMASIIASQPVLALSLLVMDAKDYLQKLNPCDYPDVIYIDPMHPLRQKSALVKKDMQALQRLIGADQDARALIDLAIQRTRDRVVVKWPQNLAPLYQPNLSINGKTVRFDVYFSTLKFAKFLT